MVTIRDFFPDVLETRADSSQSAQVVVLGMFGQSPRIEDQFLDVPISPQALAMVSRTKRVVKNHDPSARGVEPVLYGLQGKIVRVAFPRLVPQRSQVSYGILRVDGEDSSPGKRTEIVHDMTTTAQKNFDDGYSTRLTRTVARVALKMASAEGIGIGARAAVGGNNKDSTQAVGFVISALARIFAIATEEADKRSWRTLPDHIQLIRVSLKPGEHRLRFEARDRQDRQVGLVTERTVTLREGQTYFLTPYTPF